MVKLKLLKIQKVMVPYNNFSIAHSAKLKVDTSLSTYQHHREMDLLLIKYHTLLAYGI